MTNTNSLWVLNQRTQLPQEIIPSLLSPQRSQWKKHPRIGTVDIFFTYHEYLRQTSLSLKTSLELLLNENQASTVNLDKIKTIAGELIHHTRHHHSIEDKHYFPSIMRQFPQLERGLNMLDADHDMIVSHLNQIEIIASNMPSVKNSTEWLNQLHQHVAILATILPRHFQDEEEIIIPALLQS
ncbi:MAG: hypothetical protein COC19_03540 [SAR86 cluster bacterium]|uniref:Hemerythrin-like domain-containing protein n=1 Tax=SAR86 cluster bacterium TaxID=2030880 RepID=A0A2A4MPH7_9GAMM|nr:MAG: hypothetical protein COC19_03540 [SAR86 cluster bacterium]